MVREYSEELLGAPEDYDNHTRPINYDAWPFHQTLSRARAERRLRVYCLGLGVDPLTLVADILMVAVFDAEVFDDVFGHLVASNAEGRIITSADGMPPGAGLAFSQANVDRLTRSEPMQPAGAAVLQLAWQHREAILNYHGGQLAQRNQPASGCSPDRLHSASFSSGSWTPVCRSLDRWCQIAAIRPRGDVTVPPHHPTLQSLRNPSWAG